MKFRTKYSRPKSKSITFDPDKSLTIGSAKDECDINKILDTYKRTGMLPNSVSGNSFLARNPMYGDFSNATDFTTIRYKLDEAERQFMELPAHIRKRFDNDPQKLIEFIDGEGNYEEAVKLGLVEKRNQQIDTAVKPTETARTEQSAVVEAGTAPAGAEKAVGTI